VGVWECGEMGGSCCVAHGIYLTLYVHIFFNIISLPSSYLYLSFILKFNFHFSSITSELSLLTSRATSEPSDCLIVWRMVWS